jgi:hypothetical protein
VGLSTVMPVSMAASVSFGQKIDGSVYSEGGSAGRAGAGLKMLGAVRQGLCACVSSCVCSTHVFTPAAAASAIAASETSTCACV